MVNENEIAVKEKEENERRWKTKDGFDIVNKRVNWNEHSKAPHPATIAELKIPKHIQAAETKARMKGFEYNPEDHGKPDFQSKIKLAANQYFSGDEFFKTVFISGDDMVKEEAEAKKKLKDDFEKKVVVENKHFYVNTLEKNKVSQLDRFINLREDNCKKIGLRHNKRRISEMVERQIYATKSVE